MKDKVMTSIALAVAVGAFIMAFVTYHHVNELERKVECLQHPTHAISTIGPVIVKNGKVYGKTTPTTVICP